MKKKTSRAMGRQPKSEGRPTAATARKSRAVSPEAMRNLATISQFTEVPCVRCGAPEAAVNGEWLRAVRIVAGLSLREMATRLGFSAPYICDIELNRRHCTPAIRAEYERL